MSKYCPYIDGPVLYPECRECEEKICGYFFCLVVGSRSFQDYEYLRKCLDYLLLNQGRRVVIVSGGARGADSLARKYAKDNNLPYKEFPAQWDQYGKQAGYIRNDQMHAYLSKQERRGVVAFWDGLSRGTQHNFQLASKYNNPIKIISPKA